MNEYMVYHNLVGPISYHETKKEATLAAFDLDAEISNGRTDHQVVHTDTGDVTPW